MVEVLIQNSLRFPFSSLRTLPISDTSRVLINCELLQQIYQSYDLFRKNNTAGHKAITIIQYPALCLSYCLISATAENKKDEKDDRRLYSLFESVLGKTQMYWFRN